MSFLSFPHRHNFLAPIQCMEKADEDSRHQDQHQHHQQPQPQQPQPTKKRAWRSRISIPDYRKTKIGEYQDKNDQGHGDAVSDCDSSSSDDSNKSTNKSTNSQEGPSASPEEVKICPGCDRQFEAITPTAPCPTSQHQDRHKRNPFILRCNTQDVNNKFSSTNRYRCMWPGCSLVVCNDCELLLRKRREQGGAYGNLQRVREIWTSQREAEQRCKQEASTLKEVIRPYDKISQMNRADCLILTTSVPATDGPHAGDKSVITTDAADSKENGEGNIAKNGIIIQAVEVVMDDASTPVIDRAVTQLHQQGSSPIPMPPGAEVTTSQLAVSTSA